MFADLFEIERTARALELSAEETRKMREQEAVPILEKMKQWLDEQSLVALPQSSFGKAVHYNLNNWAELNNYLLDGDIRIDNNLAEQEMKRVAVGRKTGIFLVVMTLEKTTQYSFHSYQLANATA
ncbi:MAG: transposase [Cyanobacteria bacterium REEB67]|nr:transposase [Cyanobacteria bacterium REEB67]